MLLLIILLPVLLLLGETIETVTPKHHVLMDGLDVTNMVAGKPP